VVYSLVYIVGILPGVHSGYTLFNTVNPGVNHLSDTPIHPWVHCRTPYTPVGTLSDTLLTTWHILLSAGLTEGTLPVVGRFPLCADVS